ncbi:MAG: hypothetical protein HY322_20790 [Betaproteobacteria bacterium]|nr:hypothetical protein [Betaproteobacteria bacterium]
MLVTNPLRCLVIPGNHLLDVRSMWAEISPLDCFIRYLGFNEGQGSEEVGTDVHVANNAVTSLGGVVPDSQVVKDRFEAIAGNTVAYRSLRRYGPYHVVNLDLCGSMFPNTAKSVDPYYSALNRLLEYQFEAQKTLWLLFITTVVEPAVVDKESMQTLCKPIRENFAAHVDFLEKLKALCPDAVPESGKGGSVNLDGLADEELIRLFGVALGKWLLRLGQAASPKWTVAMRRSYRYSTNVEKGAVMLSLAFEMTPNFAPPVDATGMSKLRITAKQFPSELDSAVKLAESVANIADVDGKLSENAEMKAALLQEAANLLESAGFDRDAYIKWVDGGELTARA